MRAEALKGHLDLLLLSTVATSPAHGYRIVEALSERSGGSFDLAEGTVYPALYRLEKAGLLASSWEVSEQGRRRRVYRLTSKGGRALHRQRIEWESFARAVQTVVA